MCRVLKAPSPNAVSTPGTQSVVANTLLQEKGPWSRNQRVSCRAGARSLRWEHLLVPEGKQVLKPNQTHRATMTGTRLRDMGVAEGTPPANTSEQHE